jgi:Na+(H+)/acetate symporter ActP
LQVISESTLLALLPRSSLAFGLAAALFPAIILGIFDKKMNKEGAIAGMIIGLLLMLFYMLKFKFGLLMEKMLLLA